MLKSYIECKYMYMFLKLKQHVKCKRFFSVAEPKQYCWPNKFNATCPDSHVILIHSAKYGRMSRGICLKNTDISIGCQADVLTEVSLSLRRFRVGGRDGDGVGYCANRSVAQITQCSSIVSHNVPLCNRNVDTCAHFCYKEVRCGIYVWFSVGSF